VHPEARLLGIEQTLGDGRRAVVRRRAVSGTVLSFEMGLLWPKFTAHAGAIIGMPFSLEGFAFFTEAIFLGIYRPRAELHRRPVKRTLRAASLVYSFHIFKGKHDSRRH
jgi:predicted branched-subunit amino acid permease